MIATTIEQSKHLLELGLDPNTADMFYSAGDRERLFVGHGYLKDTSFGSDIPAWSLSALLEVMCYNSGIDVYFNNQYHITPSWCYHWIMREKGTITGCSKVGASKIDAAFGVVRSLIMNGYIKEGGES